MQEVKKSAKSGVFFVDLEFKESKAIFHRLGVQSLPWIVHVNPNVPVGADGVIKFKQDDVVRAALYLDFWNGTPRRRMPCHGTWVRSKAMSFGVSC